MDTDKPKNELQHNVNDYAALTLKAALGVIPLAGPALSELIGYVYPNQREERLIKFVKTLADKISHLEEAFIASQIKDETFNDLVEDGLRQATRALSDERHEYIASIIANSLSSEDIEYQESKHFMRILGELTDIEIIWLRFYLVPTTGGDEGFRNLHSEALKLIRPVLSSPQPIIDKSTLQGNYKEHLSQLALLEKVYAPQINSRTDETRLIPERFEITSLGKLLLREINFS